MQTLDKLRKAKSKEQETIEIFKEVTCLIKDYTRWQKLTKAMC